MLMNLRNALMAGKRLPYDAEVEYLESTGTQWIDTGVVMSSGITSAKIRMSATQRISRDSFLFGCSSGGNADSVGAFVNGANGIRLRWGKASPYVEINANHYSFGDILSITLSGGYVQIVNETNGYAVPYLTTGTNFSPYNFLLFGFQSGTTTLISHGARLYSCQLGSIRDFIPVRVGTTGALYDKRGVGGMNPDGTARNDGMYFNRGTGAFAYGNDLRYPIPAE